MPRCLYHTEGFILASQPFGEAGRRFDFLTARLGLATGVASGVRSLKSKLRYHLQNWQWLRLSLIRTRHHWRVVNAEPIYLSNLWSRLPAPKRTVVVRLSQLLIRLIPSETAGQTLLTYREFESIFRFLASTNLTAAGLINYEVMATWRLLWSLGYCRYDDEFGRRLGLETRRFWRRSRVEGFTPYRRPTARIINEALYHSHL